MFASVLILIFNLTEIFQNGSIIYYLLNIGNVHREFSFIPVNFYITLINLRFLETGLNVTCFCYVT